MAETATALPAESSASDITRFNALRHGVLSRYTVLPWENADEYQAIVAALVAEHAPQGPTEEHLVEEIAGIMWRKRRLRLAEAEQNPRPLPHPRDLFLAVIIRLLKAGGRAAVVLPDGTLFGEGVKTRLKEHLMQECNLHTIVRLPNSVFKPYASIGTNLLFFEKGEPTKDIWFWEHRVPEGQKAYSMTKPIRFEHLQGCADWWGGPKRKGREEGPFAWKVTAEDVKARGYNLDIKNPHTVADDHGEPEELLAKLIAAEAESGRLRDQLKTILAEALAR
jgi:type I restriction-modification system DNA methylase subunit